ncbi:DUF5916 domain-containing protein [Thermoflexibacter ruber]|uniref:Carbohydrate family 9 binding domain-like n=1 Tax=Thermoflexibacter ruber TaxID=1003 RepID=A0A1I2D5A6_9BACT|nr:DUF5916 domain-containing protein [Thermoflexibacter ruber]SFE75702.1 Carbohydrate family 9 binding domain-like [Thermoflexibacter ruber]
MKPTAILYFLLFFPIIIFAQKKNESYQYHIHRATAPIKIDGIGDESAWNEAELATDFFMVLPMDTSKSSVRTEVRMLYDNESFYLLAVNYDKLEGDYMVESLRRDFSFGRNDNFLLFLDPFDDQINGFTFGANAMGAQWDGQMFDGGSVNLNWDNKWESVVKSEDDQWVFEMKVPFKSIRYKEGIKRWGVNFSRLDMKTTEKSAWAPVPRQFPTASLAYTGILLWDEAPPRVGTNISLIPYVASSLNKNHEKNAEAVYALQAGMDAKVAVTSSLNLDLTINPDFSQVEVDRQQINLDRFELFFPERRQFFLENADLFANFGYQTIRPFFSRRIGLNAPIHFGARLSGKIDKNWRIGVMNMQTGDNNKGTPAQNFGILALQRQVFSRSNISAIFINKETFDYENAVKNNTSLTRYNRNFGFEYNLASSNNIWTGKLLFLQSLSPNSNGNDQTIAGHIQHNSRRWNYRVQYEYVGQNYNAEVGFVPRLNYHGFYPTIGHLFFPKRKGAVLSHGPSTFLSFYFDKNMQQTENELPILYRINFYNRSELVVWTATNYVKLLRPFDPTNFVGDTLATGTRHFWHSYGFDYNSKPQTLLTYSLSGRYGGFYADGKRLRLNGEVGYRIQPYAALSLTWNYNRIDFHDAEVLPERLKNQSYDIWLVGTRLDITLTNKLFFTNFLQYNNQIQNVNMNMRLQWRYSPASDLFIVYTDNYYSDSFKVRNRALVFKFTYWWNV